MVAQSKSQEDMDHCNSVRPFQSRVTSNPVTCSPDHTALPPPDIAHTRRLTCVCFQRTVLVAQADKYDLRCAILLAIALALGLGLGLGLKKKSKSYNRKGPNVLVIMTDDQGIYSSMSCLIFIPFTYDYPSEHSLIVPQMCSLNRCQ